VKGWANMDKLQSNNKKEISDFMVVVIVFSMLGKDRIKLQSDKIMLLIAFIISRNKNHCIPPLDRLFFRPVLSVVLQNV